MAFPTSRLWWPTTLFILSFFVLSKLSSLESYFKLNSVHLNAPPTADTPTVVPQIDLFLRQTTTAPNSTTGSGTYTCGPDSPCTNGACCGASGWCGYGPTYCGDGCQSNCDATAACGQYAATDGAICPLNVCCSQFGFCGTTSDFCTTGCQSNCDQPLPDSITSNVQTKIVGYWEAWNSQNPCGTMTPGQIPANMLTHLNIAFAYITADFDITNMDGVPSEIYQNVGNVKSKNPDLKIVITIGGWAFDQSIFSNMVSTSGNRATCIQNVLKWLGEYGYDGVDFDWEYPGATDRSGVPADTANYVLFLEELRAAITSSGKDYIVTFTAPTSYWYLQWFDLPGMVKSVDWINLMTYDLHGVWDAEDIYIGSEVLAHTNLTEIDLALDLFWRVGINPSDIVMGLGFYGRTYQLADASCWQPGCPFVAAGAAGPCTQTPGILSYREIVQVISDTGAAPYTDETAAVEYMVYGDNNWVSYDSALTFAAKIEYANHMGLSGLMVWAIDQDDADLDALTAVSDTSLINSTGVSFSLVPLEYLFPSDLLPSDSSTLNYGLINFGGGANTGSMDPSSTGFGFMLVSGDSSAVSNLKKRDGMPEPFVFLDCPHNVFEEDNSLVHTARVVCLSDDLKGCFQVMERGVESTIVEMPDNCAENTFARAISLEISEDQHVAQNVIGKRSPTSQVYDFKFDFNINLARQDTGSTVFRIDLCNLPTYWDSIVDAPGIQSRDLNNIENRYFAPTAATWQEKIVNYYGSNEFGIEDAFDTTINKDMSAPLFWETTPTGQCNVDGSDFTEGVAAFVNGGVTSQMYYGFTMIATIESAGLVIEPSQTSGFISVTGNTDITYGVGGVGNFDVGQANKGNPAVVQGSKSYVGGNTVDVDGGNWVTFKPYYEIDYEVATFNAATGDDDPNGVTGATAPFDGVLEARVITDFGNFVASFPPNMSDESTDPFPFNGQRTPNTISIPGSNIMYGSSGSGGSIAIATYIRYGVEIDVGWRLSKFVSTAHEAELVDYQVTWNTLASFTFTPDPSEVCVEYDIATQCFQSVSTDLLDWEADDFDLVYDRQSPDSSELCYATELDLGQKKRDVNGSYGLTSRGAPGGVFPGFGYGAGIDLDISNILPPDDAAIFLPLGVAAAALIACSNCMSCTTTTENDGNCCGCLCLRCVYGFQDADPCPECDQINVDGTWPGSNTISLPGKRENADGDLDFEATLSIGESIESGLGYDDMYLGDLPFKLEERGSTRLLPRVSGTATMSEKSVTGCGGDLFSIGTPFKYPSFPSNANYPWDNIQGGKWNAITKYYGNSSATCSNWGVFAKQTADVVFTGAASIRADYQTEHVLEGQLIGDFFKVWLDGTGVTNQPASVRIRPNPQNQLSCAWTEQFIQSQTISKWTVDGETNPFIGLLLSELGNESHLDRLTILMARPNNMKGTLFSGGRPISPDIGRAYRSMTAEGQLLAVKDMGMVFNYMNNPLVWSQFCTTFEAMYNDMVMYDTWFANTVLNQLPVNLAAEWPNFIRATLDSIVVRSRILYNTLYQIRTGAGNTDIWEANWAINQATNINLFQLPGTCTHLAGTTV